MFRARTQLATFEVERKGLKLKAAAMRADTSDAHAARVDAEGCVRASMQPAGSVVPPKNQSLGGAPQAQGRVKSSW